MPQPLKVDLTNATDEDLQTIHSDVLRRLALRAKSPGLAADYDRHGSGHSRSGGGITALGAAVNPADLAALANVSKLNK